MAAHFNLQKNGYVYLIHWVNTKKVIKISTKIKVKPTDWRDNTVGLKNPKLKDDRGRFIADMLNRHKLALQDAIDECGYKVEKIEETYLKKLNPSVARSGNPAEKDYFMPFYKEKLDEFKTAKKSNYKSYQTTYNNLTEYFASKSPTFDELTIDFCDKFKTFLELKKDYKKNTINKQITNIKAIVGKANSLKLHRNTDYKEFKAGKEPAVNVFLTLKELDKIYNLDLKNHPSLDSTRDSFIVACFTGLRFEDWVRVRKALIKDDILRIQPKKSNEVSQIPVHKYVKSILEKHKGVMPKQLSNQKTNANIKLVCKAAFIRGEFEKPFTKGGKRKSPPDRFKKYEMCATHTARRSLCTNMILQNANPYLVMKISGHKTFEAFQKYIKLDELLAVDELKKLPMFTDSVVKPVVKRTKSSTLKLNSVTQSL